MKTIRIGRSQDNDVVLQDTSVSRHHCQLMQYDDGTVAICDCGSTNGTFVNGRRVNGNVTLRRGDTVKCGSATLPWTSYVPAPRYQEPPTEYRPQENYYRSQESHTPPPRSRQNDKRRDGVDYHSVNDINIDYNEGGFKRKFGQAAGDSAGNIVGCFFGFVIVIVIIAVLGIISF